MLSGFGVWTPPEIVTSLQSAVLAIENELGTAAARNYVQKNGAVTITGAKTFQDLDRRLRQELVAIDGATLVDHKGTILAVGAILRIDGGSAGGGRLAAAIALSKLGVGIKVSQDGGIAGFHDGSDHPKFSVM